MTTETTLSPRSITALGELLRAHRKEMREDLDRLATNIGRGSGGASHGYGVRNTGGDLKAQRIEVESLIAALKRNNKALNAYEQYMLGAARKHQAALKIQIAEIDAAARAQNDNTDAVDDNTEAQEKQSKQVSAAVDGTKRFVKGLAEGTLYLKGLKEAVSEFQTSYKLGFKWDPIMDAFQGAMMGMDPKAMMEFQAQFRRTSGAMESGIDGFNKLVSENQFEMSKYTGSLQSAAVAMGSLYELSHNMGLQLSDVAGSASDLFTEFKKMQSVTSITVEQFVEMNQRLLSNNDVQGKLLRLNQQQRAQYIQGLNQQQLSLQMMGLQKEVAEQLIAASESMSGKKGLDRLQDRYKTQIALQSMLGYDSAKASRIGILKNKTNKSAEEGTEYNGYMLEMAKDFAAAKSRGELLGGVTNQGEIYADAIAEALGQNEMFAAGQPGALQTSAKSNGQALSAHQNELTERSNDWLQKIAHTTTVMSDMLGAWSQTAAAVLAGAVVASLLNRTKIVESMVGRIMSGRSGGGPGGGPGGPGGGMGKHWRGLGGGIAGLGIGLAGNLAANTLLDPNNFAAENKGTAQKAQTALSWGATGAGMGMMFGPMGAAIGGAGGALAGYFYEVHQESKNFAGQMDTAFAIGNKMLSGEQQKLLAEKEAKQQQIKALEEQGHLTDQQLVTLKKMRAELTGIDANLGVADIKQQAMGAGVANQFISKMLNNQSNFGDTGDVAGSTSQLQSMIEMAGVKGNVKDQLIANMKTAALNGGLDTNSWGDFSKIEGAIRSGDDVDIPEAWRKYVDQGFATTAQGFQRDIGMEMASVRGSSAANGTLSEAVAQQQSAVVTAEQKVKTLEEDILKMKDSSMYHDPRSGGRDVVAAKEKELEQAREVLNAQKSAAASLAGSVSGEAPLHFKWRKEDIDALTASFGNEMRKVSGKTAPAARPQGFPLLAAR